MRRRGDGTLEVGLRERLAVAKIVTLPEKGSAMQVRLVAADGRTFAGVGYPEQAVRNLPEIQHFRATGADEVVGRGASAKRPALRPPFQHFFHRSLDGECRVVEQERILGGLQGRGAAGSVPRVARFDATVSHLESLHAHDAVARVSGAGQG